MKKLVILLLLLLPLVSLTGGPNTNKKAIPKQESVIDELKAVRDTNMTTVNRLLQKVRSIDSVKVN